MIDPVMRDLDEYLDQQARQEMELIAVENQVGEYLELTIPAIQKMLPEWHGDLLMLTVLEWADDTGYTGDVCTMTGHEFVALAGDKWVKDMLKHLDAIAEKALEEQRKAAEPDYEPDDLYPHCWD